MHHFVFSTLDHHGLSDEPRVTVERHPTEHSLRIAYGRNNLYFSPAELEYTLPFEAAIPEATVERHGYGSVSFGTRRLFCADSSDRLIQEPAA